MYSISHGFLTFPCPFLPSVQINFLDLFDLSYIKTLLLIMSDITKQSLSELIKNTN